MKKIIFIILTLFLGVMSINAEDNLTPKATSSILIEASTGKVLYEKDADKKLAPYKNNDDAFNDGVTRK